MIYQALPVWDMDISHCHLPSVSLSVTKRMSVSETDIRFQNILSVSKRTLVSGCPFRNVWYESPLHYCYNILLLICQCHRSIYKYGCSCTSSLYAPFLERYLGTTEMKKDLYEKIAANVTQDQLTFRQIR